MGDERDPDAIVIGGGLAGLSAAVRLAARGVRVLVLESRPRLGGRATAFPDPATGEPVDNGQHVLFGCYTETFAFLDEIGAIGHVRVQPQLDVTMIDGRGRRSRLVCPPLPAPLHLLAGAMEWEALGWTDRLALLQMAQPLKLARDPSRVVASPGETVEQWLVRHGQTERLREMLWRPLALAALNEPADRAGAAPFARVLARLFASPRASSLAFPVKPLDQVYAEPARRSVEARGGAVATGTAGTIRLEGGRIEGVYAGGRRWTPRAVIAAVPWFAFAQIVDGDASPLSAIIERARRMRASAIVTVNLWLDRPILDEPVVGLPGRRMQWVFDVQALAGARSPHLSLVSSAAGAIVGLANDELADLALRELIDALPDAREARVRRAAVVRERQATFSLAVDQPPRPSAETPVRGLYLAGDWIETGLPATIESAVASGHRAADLALAGLGLGSGRA